MNIEYIPTFNYFSHFVENWNRVIIDFGSNNGNLLKSSNGVILEKNYTGIDVDIDSLNTGKALFPNAHWIHYDRFNPVYNPLGQDVFPEISQNVDLIISYSVFTHMTIDDTEVIIDYLISKLSMTGKMLFTFCNIENRQCVEWFRNRRIDCEEINIDDIVYLSNNKIVSAYPKKCDHFVSFYKPEFILEKFSRYNPKVYSPPAGWVQDCIELSVGS